MLFPRFFFLPHKSISKIVGCGGKKHKLTFTNFQIKNIEIIEYKVYKYQSEGIILFIMIILESNLV